MPLATASEYAHVFVAPQQHPLLRVNLPELVRLQHSHTILLRAPEWKHYIRTWHNMRKKSINYSVWALWQPAHNELPAEKKRKKG
jgi:hypothetical protein